MIKKNKKKEIYSTIIALSVFWLFAEVYWYYLDISNKIFRSSFSSFYKNYSPDYLFLGYVLISLIFRINGIVKITKSKSEGIDFFLYGQFMAIAIPIKSLFAFYPFYIYPENSGTKHSLLLILLLIIQAVFVFAFYSYKKYLNDPKPL
jgi:hypothetical protein